jgi:DNA-binding NarL/FixJ family response regulator/Tfp pilus assembly protein PilF
MHPINDQTILIVDPHAGMRTTLHDMLKLGGNAKVEFAVSAGAAIRAIRMRTYDVVLCEYDLGPGQDGQQLLEDLRHHKLLPRSTAFILVTAERANEKVMGAAECAPTDYLLKPFTADTLLLRVNRALMQRRVFTPTYQLIDRDQISEAIASCIQGANAHAAHKIKFMQLRGELHLLQGDPVEAEKIYLELMATVPLAWVQLGLAKARYLQGRLSDAAQGLTALIGESPQFLDAYDWLAKIHEASGQPEQAKTVLQDAVIISPHALRRLRQLGKLALELGDVATAEHSLTQAIRKARYSEFRDPEDHTRLVSALLKQGHAEKANEVIREIDKTMSGLDKTPACRAMASALVHTHKGDGKRAAFELGLAIAANKVDISSDLTLGLVRTCLANKMDAEAMAVTLEAMGTSPAGPVMTKAMHLFEQAGRGEMANSLKQAGRKQAQIALISSTTKAKAGDFHGAMTVLAQAVQQMPNNAQVLFHAIMATLKCLDNPLWDAAIDDQAALLLARARKLEPDNTHLAPLEEMHATVRRKHQRGGA